jgi:hypothetical protein
MEAALSDRRIHRRYPLHLPVRYTLLEGHASAASGLGVTQNLSSGGVAFVSDVAMETGSILEVWVSWPVEVNGTSRLELRMTGRVVRSDKTETAIQVKRHDFVRVQHKPNGGADPDSLEAAVSPDETHVKRLI